MEEAYEFQDLGTVLCNKEIWKGSKVHLYRICVVERDAKEKQVA